MTNTNAQIWLNKNIPLNQRNNIRELYIWPDNLRDDPNHQLNYQDYDNKFYIPFSESLTGTLDLSTFPLLENLTIQKQFINCLILTNCWLLKRINASDNLLKEVVWPESVPFLEDIFLTNNNFLAKDVSEFSRFLQLRTLFLGTNDSLRINQKIYNRWNGSLHPLASLSHLQELDINATDINSGLEYLPNELSYFTFGNKGRVGAGVDDLKNDLAVFIKLDEGKTMEDFAAEEDSLENYGNMKIIRDWQAQREQIRLHAQIQVDNL